TCGLDRASRLFAPPGVGSGPRGSLPGLVVGWYAVVATHGVDSEEQPMTWGTSALRGGGDTASEVAVRARDVARHYGEGETAVHALRGVDLDVERKRLTAVMGPSGSAKHTLMHILAGLDKPSSGDVVVAGIDIGGLDDTELTKLRRDHIGFIFQVFNLLPH